MNVQTYRRRRDAARYAAELARVYPEHTFVVWPYGFGWAVRRDDANGPYLGTRPRGFSTFTHPTGEPQ